MKTCTHLNKNIQVTVIYSETKSSQPHENEDFVVLFRIQILKKASIQ